MVGKIEIEGFRCLPTAPDFAQKDSSHVHSYTGSGYAFAFREKPGNEHKGRMKPCAFLDTSGG